MPKIQIAANANPNLPSYTIDEAERMLAEYPPGGRPKTMDALSRQYWAKKDGPAKPVPAASDSDISDLIPPKRSHVEVWARFNSQGRGRRPIEGK